MCYKGIDPFSVSIRYNKDHMAFDGSNILKMNPLPWFSGPFPGMQWCLCRGVSTALAWITMFHTLFDVRGKVKPPEIVPCQRFHSFNAWMTIVKLIPNLCTQVWGTDHSTSPQQAAILDTWFILPGLVTNTIQGQHRVEGPTLAQ